MIAVSKREQFEYVLIEDRDLPKSKQTIFVCQPLSLFAQNQVEDLIGMKATETGFPAGTVNCEILRHGLVAWRNMYDNRGAEIRMETDAGGRVKDSSLECLSTFQRTEIANAIWQTVTVTAGEAKNSNWPSPSQMKQSAGGPARIVPTSRKEHSDVRKKPQNGTTG